MPSYVRIILVLLLGRLEKVILQKSNIDFKTFFQIRFQCFLVLFAKELQEKEMQP